jgi:hypothetical protein
MAIQGLMAAGASPAAPEVSEAVDWLTQRQDPATGGFASSFGGPNANTTGLVANSLRLAGAGSSTLEAAAKFIGGLTLACSHVAGTGSKIKEADVGAVAFDAAALTDALEFGLDQTNADQFRRATSQAVLALGAPGLAELTVGGAAATAPRTTCQTSSAVPPPVKPLPSDTSAGGARAGSNSPKGNLSATGAASFDNDLLSLAVVLSAAGGALLIRRRIARIKAAAR